MTIKTERKIMADIIRAMRNCLRNNKGVSLLEMVVEIIIIFIFAVVLSGVFIQVDKQKAQIALTTMHDIANAIEGCNIYGKDCNTWEGIMIKDPSDKYFTYSYIVKDNYYLIKATSTKNDSNSITLDKTGCKASGVFVGIGCN